MSRPSFSSRSACISGLEPFLHQIVRKMSITFKVLEPLGGIDCWFTWMSSSNLTSNDDKHYIFWMINTEEKQWFLKTNQLLRQWQTSSFPFALPLISWDFVRPSQAVREKDWMMINWVLCFIYRVTQIIQLFLRFMWLLEHFH